MTRDEATALIAAALRRVAPEAELDHVDPDDVLAEELDLDSMDVLGLLEGLSERAGIELSDQDAPATASLRDLVDRLVERSS